MWIPASFRKVRQTLAAEWQALAAMAVAMARKLLRIRGSQPLKALAQAEMLEAWTLCSIAKVMDQIAAEGAEAHAAKPYTDQLPPIAVILWHFLRFLRGVIAKLRARLAAMRWTARAAPRSVPARMGAF